MAKPFSIQSPEDIAKEYAGNKQKIAQAMQMGIVDPTAGVLAGMFIDRMRAGQMQEQAPQMTVAQQVMGGAPPASAPPSAAGGLGATAPAAPPMAPPTGMPPEMGMAPPMPEGAPMGMAEGGLAMLPVPDAMFDEPNNGGYGDGYAGGGIVAFSDGGDVDLEAFRRAIIAQESGGRYGVPNAQGSGAMGIGQIMPDTARALAKRLGLDYRPDLLAGTDKAARQYQDALTAEATREAWQYGKGDIDKAAAYYFAGPNQQGWGKKTRQYQSDIRRRLGTAGEAAAPAPATAGLAPPTETLESMLPAAFKAGEDYYAANMPKRTNEGLGLLTEQARAVLDPEAQKKQRTEDKWMMLAEIGFNMAASNSPFLLQAASSAAAAALPGARAAKKEREAAKREAIRDLAAAEDITYKQAAERANSIRDFATMQLGLKDKDLTRASGVWERMYSEQAQTERTRMSVEGEKDVAGIRVAADAVEAVDKKPTTAQAASLMPGYKSRYEDALKRMQAAEETGDYAAFKTARGELNNAFSGYNALARQLGLPPLVSNKLGDYPQMSKKIAAERAQGGTGGKKSSAMEEADRIIAGGR